jgi:hypothetical protein
MFDLDAHLPRINNGMVYLGACLIAGIRPASRLTAWLQKTLAEQGSKCWITLGLGEELAKYSSSWARVEPLMIE